MLVAINSVKACPRTQHSERLVIQFRYVPGVLIIVSYTCIVRCKSTVNMLLQFSVLSVVDTFFWNKDLSSIRKCDISSSQHPFSNTLMWTACTTGMTLTIQNHTLLPSVILITRHGMQIVSISQHRISLIEIQMQLKLFVFQYDQYIPPSQSMSMCPAFRSLPLSWPTVILIVIYRIGA